MNTCKWSPAIRSVAKKPVRLIGVGISNFVLEEKIAKKSGFSYQLFDKPDD